MNKRKIVLLLEDNIKILDLNRRILEKDGCMVITAKTIAEARERLEILIPDIAVLDIMLPDGSGLDFFAELHEKYDIPALFLTAKAEHDDIIAGLSAGGNDYMTKPYNIDEFRLRVAALLRLVNSARPHNSHNCPSSLLLPKELNIALLAAEGMRNKEIGEKVYLSESRVKTCLSIIYRKLKISNNNSKGKRLMLAGVLGK